MLPKIMVDGATKGFVQAYNAQVAVEADFQLIVGQAVTQAPQPTQELSRRVVPESGTILISAPLSSACQTDWPCTSSQILTQRKHVMHCDISTRI